MIRSSFAFYGLLCLALASLVEGKTAVLFGATGTVGNEVLRSIFHHESLFTKLVIVGRSFPSKVTDLLQATTVEVVRIELQDLGSVDTDEQLLALGTADACFIATGSGHPYLSDLASMHYVEIEMTASMTKLCSKLGVQSLTTFSAADAPENPTPYTKEELDRGSDGTPLGWFGMIYHIFSIYGLKERAVLSNALPTIPIIRIFQPSTIVTAEIRYGWVDRVLFKIHSWMDPWIPSQHRSVPVGLLGKAMVEDAVAVLSSDATEPGVTRFTYNDFVRIAGTDSDPDATTTEL